MERVIERLIDDGGVRELSDAFELVREIEGREVVDGVPYGEGFKRAHEYSREIRQRAGLFIYSDPIGYTEVIRRSLLFDAPWDLDCAIRYAEWNREKERRFYPSRRKQLLPIVRAMEDLEYRRINRLLICLPPGVGKTTLALFFLVWSGSRNPEKGILTGSHNICLVRYSLKTR